MSAVVRKGLTVLEIVIILVIIGLLLLIVIPRFTAPTLTVVAAPDSVVAANTSGPVAVRVTNRNGTPQRGVRIEFEVAGSGAVTPAEVQSDSTGTASTTWHAAADSGRIRIVAHPAGRTSPELEMIARVAASATPTVPAPAAQPRDTAAAASGAAGAAGRPAADSAKGTAPRRDSATAAPAPPRSTP